MELIEYNLEMDLLHHPQLVQIREFDVPENNWDSAYYVAHQVQEMLHLQDMAEEYIYVIGFTAKCRPTGIFDLSHGTVSAAILQPREIFIRLFLCGASHFILVHNHPSGDCTPSQEDLGVTERIMEAGELIGIPLVDSIIIARNGYYSFKKGKS